MEGSQIPIANTMHLYSWRKGYFETENILPDHPDIKI